MTEWRVEESPDGLRLAAGTRRGLGSEELTWAELLYFQLAASTVLVLYFLSRFGLSVDTLAHEALTVFAPQGWLDSRTNRHCFRRTVRSEGGITAQSFEGSRV